MRTNLLLAVVAASGLGVLSGCPDEPASVPLAEALDRYGQVACERLQECSALGAVLLSQTTCEQVVWSYRNGALSRLSAWVDDGTVAYDAEAMASCIDDLTSAACVDLAFGNPADVGRCGEAVVGQVAVGGGCEHAAQCQAGNYCATDLACPGTCQPRVVAAGACTLDEACAAGLDCAAGHCVAFGRAGATCGTSALPTCAMGFQCDTGRDPATCQPVTWAAASAASCNPTGGVLCAEGLVCAQIALSPATYQCQAPAAAGGPCFRAVPAGCPTGQACVVATGQVTGTCMAQGAVGQACLTGSGVLFGCVPGAACDSGTDLCVALVANGAACTANAQCYGDCVGGLCEQALACD